MVDLLVKCT